ncbi:MAG TPA: mechanosensitive ion channel protein MscS [Candidatus Marinimicrobia bacterium]|nr:mechanosensitive ion channel protein MscS [Candidatus Neomarinimicrobiota bacterium]
MEALTTWIGQIHWEILVIGVIEVILILIGTRILLAVLHRIIQGTQTRVLKSHQKENSGSETEKRLNTLFTLIWQGIALAVWLTGALIILDKIGIEIGPILAGAGILGLAVGFGAQNLVKDVISGFFIILENQIRVGDVAILDGTSGLVEKINFRTTVLRDLSGVVHVFPNGSINLISNMTKEWSAHVFQIGVAYKENTDDVTAHIKQVLADLAQDAEFGPLILEEPEIFGVDQLGDSAVVIKGRVKTVPGEQWKVGREFIRRVKLQFDAHNIEIPFPHQTLYWGEGQNPTKLVQNLKNG